MKYQLDPDNPFQLNGTLTANTDGTFSQPVIINPRIVGDTYGFLSPTPSKNTFNAILPREGKDFNDLMAMILIKAEEFCKQQYPDT